MNIRLEMTEKARRKVFSLDGEWEFRHEEGQWRTIHVPGVWQAQFDDLRFAGGTGTYRRRLSLSARRDGRQLALRFGAVNYFAEVRLNGCDIGKHEGGWLPFELIPDQELWREDNELEVRVGLPSAAAERPKDQPSFAEIPHGKQSWYGPLSGIWQSVWIEDRHPQHVRQCRIFSNPSTGAVEVVLHLAQHESVVADVAIVEPGGNIVAHAQTSTKGRETKLILEVRQPLLWFPDNPALYSIVVRLVEAGTIIDEQRESFGFRSIHASDGRFFLNGEPLYLRGALDQDYYAEGLATPPSVAFLEDQARKAKALGLNCLRCHIKVPDPRYYDVADRLGILIWAEIPNFAKFSETATARLWTTLEGVLQRDGNHPSIIAWTIVNEDWGTDLDEDPVHRQWLAQAYDRLKTLDSTRLVVDNSPCFPNFHVRTDINDFHYYRAIPDHRDEWDIITEQFASRPDWAFAPDGRQSGKEPLVVSEFGVWGLPHPKNLRDADGKEPWWFETGELFGDGVAYPHGAERRFQLLALDQVFGSFDDFIAATQKHQFNALKYQIEKLRQYASIQGYIVTELSDVYWEANGLMDMKRNPRMFADALAELNRDIVVLPRLDRYAYWCGQPIRLSAAVATGAERLDRGGSIEWSLGAKGPAGRVNVSSAGPSSIVPAVPVEAVAPCVEKPAMLGLELILRDHADQICARNITEIAVYPRRGEVDYPSIWTEDESIVHQFGGLGYEIAASEKSADLVILRAIDTDDVESIRTGARVLLLADGPGSDGWLRSDHPVQAAVPTVPAPVNPPFPGIMRRVRRGNVWRGDWITNFGWLARRGAFSDMPGGPLLDLSFDRVVPEHVLWGSIRPWEYEAGIMAAGVVVGWVHKPAGYIMTRHIGAGKLVMTSFRLTRDAPGHDPVAAALIDRLVQTTLAPL
jgi:Glycosyl hydrolases family 2/Glycosyl hydrolases family 2, TIM barrel domain